MKRETAVLEGALLKEYLHDLDVVVSFADLNRQTIAKIICDHMGLTVTDRFSCIHNYIDTEYMILRKGAISARILTQERLNSMPYGVLRCCRTLCTPQKSLPHPPGLVSYDTSSTLL